MDNEHGNDDTSDGPAQLPPIAAEAQRYNQEYAAQSKADKPRAEHRKSFRRSWRAASPLTKLEVVFAGIIATATFAYCCFSGWQLVLLRQQIGLTQVAVQQAKTDNATAIDAQQKIAQNSLAKSQQNFQQSMDSASEQTRLDQRAWVSVTEVTGIPEVEKPWHVQVLIRNTGKTVAKGVRLQSITEQVVKGKQPDYIPIQAPGAPGVISPGSFAVNDIAVSKGAAVPQRIYDAYMTKDLRLFVSGTIRYMDIFGVGHVTKFCYFYSVPEKLYFPCNSHNDAN